jgi:hypothetical protein
MSASENQIVVYQPNETVRLDVRLENETVWLTQAQLCDLFQRDVSVISRHIKNIFAEGELEKESNLHFLQIANSDRVPKHLISPADVTTFNAQYPKLAVRYTESFHDRFLIIDDKELYLIGASLKDLGSKCFAFTKLDAGEIRRIKKSAFAAGARTRDLV